MKNNALIIEKRLRDYFQPTQLKVIDDSQLHVGHEGYQGGGRHFTVVIAAYSLEGLSRIDAHRKIYALFLDMIPHQIHALRIKIIS